MGWAGVGGDIIVLDAVESRAADRVLIPCKTQFIQCLESSSFVQFESEE